MNLYGLPCYDCSYFHKFLLTGNFRAVSWNENQRFKRIPQRRILKRSPWTSRNVFLPFLFTAKCILLINKLIEPFYRKTRFLSKEMQSNVSGFLLNLVKGKSFITSSSGFLWFCGNIWQLCEAVALVGIIQQRKLHVSGFKTWASVFKLKFDLDQISLQLTLSPSNKRLQNVERFQTFFDNTMC